MRVNIARFIHLQMSTYRVNITSFVIAPLITLIDVTKWEACAQARSMIQTGARTAETNRIAEAQKKRAARKARLYSTTSTSAGPTCECTECGRVLQARIGLISHLSRPDMRMHRVWKSATGPNWTD